MFRGIGPAATYAAGLFSSPDRCCEFCCESLTPVPSPLRARGTRGRLVACSRCVGWSTTCRTVSASACW